METAVILAGGRSSRMGRDKLLLTFDGQTLLERAVSRFSAVFERVVISVADIGKFPEYGDMRVADIHPGLGPLSGLHAALSECGGDGVFLTAADMPFASPGAALEMVRLARGSDACVIRYPDGKLEPLFAYYGAALLCECERLIRSGRYNMARLFEGVRTRYVPPDALGALWAEDMLLNINNPADYEKIQKPGLEA